MLNFLRRLIPEHSRWRKKYHYYSAIFAAIMHGFPANRLKIIAVTGTSGKSTTVELIHYLLQNSGVKTGAISGIQFRIGDQKFHNDSLRTTLRPWKTQQLLRRMLREKCEYCVIEVSSHAMDQNRLWGVSIDTAVLTNIYDNEHIDYHQNFAEYLRAKAKLFKGLNTGHRKPQVPKIMILNRDDHQFDFFKEIPADRTWSYSLQKPAEITAQNLELTPMGTHLDINLPNHKLHIATPIVGKHNIENILAAIAAVSANGVEVGKIETLLKKFPGIPGRLEPINMGQRFSVVVDFSYKPSGLQAVLSTLTDITPGNIICIWGGAGGRAESNHEEAARIIDQFADHFVLTTDDPLDENPKKIAKNIRNHIKRKEGEKFFEIEDRYEAIRYGIFIAEPGDCVLIAGRGHETTQTIGMRQIPFDDRVIAQEILQFAKDHNFLNEDDL